MTEPAKIEIPLPENLPMIDKAFAYSNLGDEEEFDLETWPGMIGEDLALSLQWPGISKLLGILQPTIRGFVVKSLEDLVLCTQSNKAKFLEDAEDYNIVGFTDELLQAFLLHRVTTYPNHIDWRSLARLFNESSPQDQKEIDRFFWEYHRCMFEDLLKHKGMDLPVPAVLLTNNETRQDGVETFIHPSAREASSFMAGRDSAHREAVI